ncbi:MAG: hypothetical protein JWO94_546, partial [Verrucomicrobiaceae bacterium]|nr:hypothetical protein [Verrucomicrobiaceae bacterium]
MDRMAENGEFTLDSLRLMICHR